MKFLSLSLDVASEIENNRAVLHSLEGQVLKARLKAARGHCSKIANIYKQFLDPWFQRVADLNKAEREELRSLFYGLSESDSLMVDVLDDSARWLGDQAERVLDLLERGKIEEAQGRIAAAGLGPNHGAASGTGSRVHRSKPHKLEAAESAKVVSNRCNNVTDYLIFSAPISRATPARPARLRESVSSALHRRSFCRPCR